MTGGGGANMLFDPQFRVQERTAAERVGQAFIDPKRDERIERRVLEGEEQKDEYLNNIQEIVEHPDDFRARDRARRTREYYGEKALRRGADALPGYQGEKSWLDVFGRVGKKAAFQGATGVGILGIIGGVTVGSAAALLTGPALAGLGLAVGAGALGRGVYEAYRKISGKEQKRRQEIEGANEAIAVRIGELADEASAVLGGLRLEKPTLPAQELEKSPQYLSILNEIIELMQDDSTRRVRVVLGERGSSYKALHKDEQVAEGEKVINIREAELALRKQNKRAETISDVVALVSSLGSIAAVKALAGGAIGEYFAERAADNATSALARGEAIGPYDFDKNAPSHYIKAIGEGITAHMDRATGIWRDTITNMRSSIFQAEFAKMPYEIAKGTIVGAAGGLVNLFASKFWRGKGETTEENINQSSSGRVRSDKRLFGSENISTRGQNGSRQVLEVELGQERQKENIPIPVGQQIRISKNKKYREEIGLHDSLDDAEFFVIERYEGDAAIIVPIKDDGSKETRRGYPRIAAKDLDLSDPLIRRNVIEMSHWQEPSIPSLEALKTREEAEEKGKEQGEDREVKEEEEKEPPVKLIGQWEPQDREMAVFPVGNKNGIQHHFNTESKYYVKEYIKYEGNDVTYAIVKEEQRFGSSAVFAVIVNNLFSAMKPEGMPGREWGNKRRESKVETENMARETTDEELIKKYSKREKSEEPEGKERESQIDIAKYFNSGAEWVATRSEQASKEDRKTISSWKIENEKVIDTEPVYAEFWDGLKISAAFEDCKFNPRRIQGEYTRSDGAKIELLFEPVNFIQAFMPKEIDEGNHTKEELAEIKKQFLDWVHNKMKGELKEPEAPETEKKEANLVLMHEGQKILVNVNEVWKCTVDEEEHEITIESIKEEGDKVTIKFKEADEPIEEDRESWALAFANSEKSG